MKWGITRESTIKFEELDGQVIEATAPYSNDFEVLVNQLEKFARLGG